MKTRVLHRIQLRMKMWYLNQVLMSKLTKLLFFSCSVTFCDVSPVPNEGVNPIIARVCHLCWKQWVCSDILVKCYFIAPSYFYLLAFPYPHSLSWGKKAARGRSSTMQEMFFCPVQEMFFCQKQNIFFILILFSVFLAEKSFSLRFNGEKVILSECRDENKSFA